MNGPWDTGGPQFFGASQWTDELGGGDPWEETTPLPTFAASANGFSLYLQDNSANSNQDMETMVEIGRVLERLSIPNESVTYVIHDNFGTQWLEIVFTVKDDAMAFRLASSLPFQTAVP